ncbi:carboxypeptidase-like regulatory domain-containing protein [Candidatus Latescibacterota bacterium]
MKIFLVLLHILLILSVVSCIFSANDDYDKGVDASGTYNITGKFTDGSGNPIVGLTVQLTGKSQASALTDATGTYVFSDVGAGSYTVTPGDKGYGSKDISVTNADVNIGTNSDFHGYDINGDYSCMLCH